MIQRLELFVFYSPLFALFYGFFKAEWTEQTIKAVQKTREGMKRIDFSTKLYLCMSGKNFEKGLIHTSVCHV